MKIIENVRRRIRTLGLLIRSQTLYPAELCTHIIFYYKQSFIDMPETGIEPVRGVSSQDFKSCASASSATRAYNGRYRARTYDPLLVRQVLSQLS